MQFFTDIKRSVSDASFYKEAIRRPMWPAVFHLYGLLVIAAFLGVVAWSVQGSLAMPKIREAIATFEKEGRDVYPAELVVTVESGALRTNVEEPYAIDLPESWKTMHGGKAHFIVIDTKASVGDYGEKDALVLVTKDAVAYPENQNSGTLKVQPLGEDADFILNRDKADAFVDMVMPYVKLLPALLALLAASGLVVFPFFIAVFTTIGYLVYLLIAALLLFVAVHLAGRPFTYGQVLRSLIYGLPVPLLYWVASGMVPAARVPYLFSLLLLAWAWTALWKLPKPANR